MILSALFPNICLACGSLLKHHTPIDVDFLCSRCFPLQADLDELERHSGSASLFLYGGPISQVLGRIKYSRHLELIAPLGRLLSDMSMLAPPVPWDLMVPVPLHPIKLLQRGFNQSLLLARESLHHRQTRQGLGSPVKERLPLMSPRSLRRRRYTPSQSSLSAEARKCNVEGAFTAHGDVKHKRILLFDDVTTTGATLKACSRALYARGASNVGSMTLLRTLSQEQNIGC